MVKSRRERAWDCLPDLPVNRSPKTCQEDAILSQVGFRR